MSQVKTTQIDDLLNQLDRKDESKKRKRVFLIFGLLFLGIAVVFFINFFLGKDSDVASVDKQLNIDDFPESSVIVVPSSYNNEEASTEEDLNDSFSEEEEKESEEEEVESVKNTDSELKKKEAEKRVAEKKEKEEKETNKNASLIAENNSETVYPGISNRSFSASEVANIPFAQTFNENEPKKTLKPKKKDKISEPIIDEKPTEPIVEEVTDEKPAEPVVEEVEPEVVEAAPKLGTATKSGVTRRSSYPGGESKMNDFFARNLSYPSTALDKEVEGNVTVRIRVNENGEIINSEIVKGLGFGCDKEVLKAISKMPKWDPAMKNGKPIEQYYMIAVGFQLPK